MRYGCSKGHFQADCSFGFCFHLEGLPTLNKSFSCFRSKKVSKQSNLQSLCTEENFEGKFSTTFLKNVSSFERNFSRNYILRIRRNNLIFYWSLPCFEIDKVPPERSQSFGPQTQQVVKIANYVFGRSLISIFCNDWTFLFSNFLGLLAIFFFAFWTKKIRRVVKRAHYVSGGAFQGFLFFKRNYFGKFRKKFKKNLALVPEKFVTFVKTVFYVSNGTFVWKKKIIVQKILIFQFFGDFELRINGISVEKK